MNQGLRVFCVYSWGEVRWRFKREQRAQENKKSQPTSLNYFGNRPIKKNAEFLSLPFLLLCSLSLSFSHSLVLSCLFTPSLKPSSSSFLLLFTLHYFVTLYLKKKINRVEKKWEEEKESKPEDNCEQ